jgi:hypothetical protein
MGDKSPKNSAKVKKQADNKKASKKPAAPASVKK